MTHMDMKTLKDGFRLLGGELDTSDDYVTICIMGFTVCYAKNLTDDEVAARMFYFSHSLPEWVKLIRQALEDEEDEEEDEATG